MTLINMKHRYVATAICPLGKSGQAECAALAERIFAHDAEASAALVAHLESAECHTREQLAHVVGGGPAYTHSYRLVHEDRVSAHVAA